MSNIDLEALAIEHLQSEHFANYLAECISTLYNQKLMDEFSNEVNKAMDLQVKATINRYLAEFGNDDIERLIDNSIRTITKKDILEKL